MLGNRPAKQILTAPFHRRHYVALLNMPQVYPDLIDSVTRYLTGGGHYPCQVRLRTPLSVVAPRLYGHHDMLTVNEVFCRRDYPAGAAVRTVVDLGSNIGISALYFLTRNDRSRCFLYEPDPRNTAKLKLNLGGFEGRYRLVEAAVSDESGRREFGVEATGRYGGMGARTGETITVDCLHINDVIRSVLKEAARIDILKIDTEGAELKTVEAIDPALARQIDTIYLEATPRRPLHPELFRQEQYGTVCRLTRRA